MDSLDVKLEKRKAILRYRQMRRIAGSLRFIEIAVILFLISKLTIQFPSAVKNSGAYFRDLSVVLVSPRFVFVLGNIIVITLFAKSGKLTSQNLDSKNPVTDLYEEFIEKSERSQASQAHKVEKREKQSKQRIREEGRGHNTEIGKERKSFRRSQSENFNEMNRLKSCKQLERSETEKYIKWSENFNEMNRLKSCKQLERSETEKYIKWREEAEESCYPEDGMTNEEFRDAIEAFIARQKRFRREEECLVTQ